MATTPFSEGLAVGLVDNPVGWRISHDFELSKENIITHVLKMLFCSLFALFFWYQECYPCPATVSPLGLLNFTQYSVLFVSQQQNVEAEIGRHTGHSDLQTKQYRS